MPAVELEQDELRLLEMAAAHGGRYVFRGLPLREMVAIADLAFILQRRQLVTADVIYCNGYPEVIPVALTHAGIQRLEKTEPALVEWMHEQAAHARSEESVPQQLVRHQQRLVELERQLARETERRELLALEEAAVQVQADELHEQLRTQEDFVRGGGVLWRRAASTVPADAYCPTCRLRMAAVAAENRLACPGCGFTAPFRPRQLAVFQPRPA